ncbi:MAG: hypothetical protein ACTSRK_09745 [Promethearchaeota archaeon]
MDEQTPKLSTKNENKPISPDVNSIPKANLAQESDSPSIISEGDFRPFPTKPFPSEVQNLFEHFQVKYTVRPRYNPFLPGISEVNHYFPEYEPLFKYLNYCTQSFNMTQKNPKDSSSEIKGGSRPDYLSQKSLPFPLHKKALIVAPSGHGLYDFLSIYAQIFRFHLAIVDVSIITKGASKIHQIDSSEQIADFIKNPLHLPGIFVFQFNNHSVKEGIPVVHRICEFIHDLQVKNFPAVGLVLWNTHIFDLGNFTSDIDFCFQFSYPTLENRTHFLAALPSIISENRVDFEHIARQLKGWNFHDIQAFYMASQQYFVIENSFLNRKGEEPAITTEYILDLLVAGTFSYRTENQSAINNFLPSKIGQANSDILRQTHLISSNASSPHTNSNFILQMYQEAATIHYNSLTLILDKLQKGILLQKEELSLLGDYPFILKDSPETALSKLQKAQIRVNQLKSLK